MIINAIKDGVGITGGGSGAKPPVLEQLNATENGTYTPSDGVDGFNPVNVDVQPPLQTKSVEITSNGQSTVVADSEYYGLGSVGLNVNVQPNLQTKSTSTTITSNGTSTITLQPDSNYDGLSSASVDVSVNVQPKLQAKSTSTTITSNGTSTITLEPDSNYDGLSSASVTITTNVESSGGGGKYVVPNGMKFAYSSVFNPDDFDFSNVTDMSHMFHGCYLTSLDLSGLDTSIVTDMREMFSSCSRLTSIDLSNFNTSKVTDMSKMFYICKSLTSLDLSNFDTSQVTDMSNMFSGCSGLTSLNLSNWNMSKVIYMSTMFYKPTNLTDLNMNGAILPKTNLTNWKLDTCTKLTVDSLVSVLNALQQLNEGESYTCTIGSTNLAKLSDDQKAIATNKHWVLN